MATDAAGASVETVDAATGGDGGTGAGASGPELTRKLRLAVELNLRFRWNSPRGFGDIVSIQVEASKLHSHFLNPSTE